MILIASKPHLQNLLEFSCDFLTLLALEVVIDVPSEALVVLNFGTVHIDVVGKFFPVQ